MSMSFTSRIKKEMTEGIVRAILEDAQYRVIDSGIEKVLRELSCLTSVGRKVIMSHFARSKSKPPFSTVSLLRAKAGDAPEGTVDANPC
ncbi:hypothetical protein KTE71_28780, partial [Burkholderia multivorans]|nr:hypothetical protein [Burkholderia multivorans]